MRAHADPRASAARETAATEATHRHGRYSRFHPWLWRHAITDSELLLEEEGLSAAVSAQLDDIRSRSRTILGLVPQMLADDGTVGGGARSLGDDARELQAAAAALRVSGHGLPPSDLGLIVPATSSNLRAG